jgi:putative nucleotidyltransferase with HDIG domain
MTTPVLLIIVAVWVAILLFVLTLLRAASGADRAAARQLRDLGIATPDEPQPTDLPGQGRRRALLAAEALALAAVAFVAVRSSQMADWQPEALTGLLGVLAVAADLQTFRAREFRISASFPAIVVAMWVLGPAPAVAIGVACTVADASLRRPRLDELVNDLLGYTAPALIGALLIHAAGATPGGQDALTAALVVIGVYLLASALNFLIIAGHSVLLARGRLVDMVRANLVPVLPWEAGAATLTGVAVYVYEIRGAAGLAVLAIAGIAFQWLLRAVMEGQRRGTVIERQSQELGDRHAGMIGLALRLLAVRDPASARHAAAVAHDARTLARAAGLSEREQDVVHAAGLLHDIGQQAFPDELLTSALAVDAAGRQAIRRHPHVAADILRQLPGMWEVADAVEAHHERVDGTGYPHGLTGNRIPRTARILAVAEVYDVLTSDDSYRGAHGHEWAASELRRVAGSQLDGRLVDLFLEVVPQRRPRPSLEEELPTARGARSLFDPRPAVG